MKKRLLWKLFIVFALIIGLYPMLYFLIDRKFGLLQTKSDELLSNTIWNITFYTHIILGGIALLIGWIQFSLKIRSKNIQLHRTIGKIYVVSVLLSAIAGIYIGAFATGGLWSSIGFICLALFWFSSTFIGYRAIRKGKISSHHKMMIYSYAACSAAITLRLWLPLLIIITSDFITAYRIVAWMCWIPNVFVAYFLVKQLTKKKGADNLVIENN